MVEQIGVSDICLEAVSRHLNLNVCTQVLPPFDFDLVLKKLGTTTFSEISATCCVGPFRPQILVLPMHPHRAEHSCPAPFWIPPFLPPLYLTSGWSLPFLSWLLFNSHSRATNSFPLSRHFDCCVFFYCLSSTFLLRKIPVSRFQVDLSRYASKGLHTSRIRVSAFALAFTSQNLKPSFASLRRTCRRKL